MDDSPNLPPIVVIGDPIIDRYTRHTIVRPNPEAPTTGVSRANRVVRSSRLGGALNVAANVRGALDAVALPAGAVYLCHAQVTTEMVNLAREVGVDLRSIGTLDLNYVPAQKERVLVDERLVLRVDYEPDEPTVIAEPVAASLAVAAFEGWGPTGPTAVVVVDYDKGTVTPDLLRHVAAQARRFKEVPVLLDLKPRSLALLMMIDADWRADLLDGNVVRCNLGELRDALELVGGVEEPAEAMTGQSLVRLALQRLPLGSELIATTPQGALFGSSDAEDEGVAIGTDFVPAPRVPVDRAKELDPCGAGDVFSAYAIVGAVSTDDRLEDLHKSLGWACAAATASCLQKGTTQITWTPDDRVRDRLGVSCHVTAS